MKKEIELILLAILKEKKDAEVLRISELLNNELDWIYIGGMLVNHRLAGYFLTGLNVEQKKKVPKELCKIIELIIVAQGERQTMINKEVNIINKKLVDAEIRFAGIKGIFLGTELYDIGDRRSNDIDLLVYEEDLDKLDKAMRELGYIQSNCPNGALIEASKKEKLIQRMNYHDLVPYVKQIDGVVLEIDINFLFDSKDNHVDSFVYADGLFNYDGKDYSITGLSSRMHLAFLIVHFYREATNSLWTKTKRDLTFYKIADLINYIRHIENGIDVSAFVEILEKLNIAAKSYYVFSVLKEFYDDEFVNDMIERLKKYEKENIGDIYLTDKKAYVKREVSFFDSVFG